MAIEFVIRIIKNCDSSSHYHPRTKDEQELDDFESGEYRSEELDSKFPKVQDGDSSLSKSSSKEEEFVDMIGDVLKMRRSLCVHRNFQVGFLFF